LYFVQVVGVFVTFRASLEMGVLCDNRAGMVAILLPFYTVKSGCVQRVWVSPSHHLHSQENSDKPSRKGSYKSRFHKMGFNI
jgi:hypothetical protein